ncbi:MAG: 6-phosphogluconolactonase, partial [Actinomycetes bacterium]
MDVWWGDERWLPRDDDERNEKQARRALLDHVPVDAAKVHPFPASDDGLELEAAAAAYADELRAAAPEGEEHPRFAITFLGVGPDGHIASLFPGFAQLDVTDAVAVGVTGSPKPPPEPAPDVRDDPGSSRTAARSVTSRCGPTTRRGSRARSVSAGSTPPAGTRPA